MVDVFKATNGQDFFVTRDSKVRGFSIVQDFGTVVTTQESMAEPSMRLKDVMNNLIGQCAKQYPRANAIVIFDVKGGQMCSMSNGIGTAVRVEPEKTFG